MMSTNEDRELKQKIYWRLRRGLLELDFILSRFWQQCNSTLNNSQIKAFDSLLDCQDPDLLDWLLYRADNPKSIPLQEIVMMIRNFFDNEANFSEN